MRLEVLSPESHVHDVIITKEAPNYHFE